jgi:hypothetical protein
VVRERYRDGRHIGGEVYVVSAHFDELSSKWALI